MAALRIATLLNFASLVMTPAEARSKKSIDNDSRRSKVRIEVRTSIRAEA